ncbi:MAG: DEAD/DEAH box helicase [Alphaproteobacteria bacterium]
MAEPLLRALDAQKLVTPTPIQTQTIPYILSGQDVMGIAQTGTGKTAAFGLPLLQLLDAENRRAAGRCTRALILAPTRELALQIEAALRGWGRDQRLRICAIVGGVARRPQVLKVSGGVDILVGTPGRIVDLMSTGELKLDMVSHFILDEADRMLDLGFSKDIRRIANALPRKRTSLLFSATMPDDVVHLAEGLLNDPVRVEVSLKEVAPLKIEQQVYYVPGRDKRDLLNRILADEAASRVIVFTRTKHGANRVAEHLAQDGTQAEALHGNKSQAARQKSLDRFKTGRARVLVATDIAARGIDVTNVSHVINFDLPDVAESYVHRIGRTARAGASGVAITFCDANEAGMLRQIERHTGCALAVAGGTAPVRTQGSQSGQGSGQRGRFGKGLSRNGNNQGSQGGPQGGPRNRRGKPGQRRSFQAAA